MLSALEERALKSADVSGCRRLPGDGGHTAGAFIMGAPEDESHSDSRERPQHNVTFASRFAVGRFAITFREWTRASPMAGGKYQPWTKAGEEVASPSQRLMG